MNGLSLPCIVAALLTTIGSRPIEAQVSPGNGAEPTVSASVQTNSESEPAVSKLKIPPLIKIGDARDRVREVQATLNKKLKNEITKLPKRSRVFPIPHEDIGKELKETVRKITITSDVGRVDLRIRGDWEPCDKKGNIIARELLPEDIEKDKFLRLPDQPLLVDGVYGQHTYVGVLMFQLEKNLQLTGEVDAVTLDKLEPMVPHKWILKEIMSWYEEHSGLDSKSDSYAKTIKRRTGYLATILILIVSYVIYRPARTLANTPKYLPKWLYVTGESPWFKALGESKIFVRMAQFAPALFIYIAAKLVFPAPDQNESDPFPFLNTFLEFNKWISRFGLAYAAFICMRVGQAFLDTCDEIYTSDLPDDNPIDGIIRTVKRLVVLVGVVLIVAAFSGRTPVYFVGGLGAFMAVIVLVFRDSILGLVASIQILANKMVEIDDWIEMPKYGADGDVKAISLNCVKIQNFDKTISMIPTHALLSEGFRNWSGLQSVGGRRIKRSIFIDMHSIKVCTPEMIERFEKIQLISEYIQQKRLEIEQDNDERDIEASPVNGRQLTNIGTFRAYLKAYLEQHPKLSGELTYLVRHLRPTKVGLPIEVYAFCNDTVWANFEAIQADIFDHLLSILPEFGLRAFQDITSTPST